MNVSARNKLKGKIIDVTKGSVMAKVKLDIGGGNVINSIITIDSVDELNLKQGDEVYAIVKSTEVMIGTCHCAKDSEKQTGNCGCGCH